MVMYRGVWCFIGGYGDVPGRMVMYRDVWECTGVYGDL